MLLAVYLATLAPGLTFWDAGEFIAAVHTFGIPHPPGTPFYILVARVWRELLPAMETAPAVNLLSAVSTAVACALGGGLVAARARGPAGDGDALVVGLAATVAAGAMSTVWLNATETEVYAISLLLSALMLCAAERAGRRDGTGWVILTGYLMALSSPLHLGALVAAPAAIVLAADRGPAGTRWDRALALLGCATAAAAASLGSLVVAGIALLSLAASAMRPAGRPSPSGLEPAAERPRSRRWMLAAACALVTFVALTAQLILLVRAGHDPGVNQGNPSSWEALLSVVTREQYAVAPLWPRQAPIWIQVGNLLEYVDWQVALGLAPGVAPSPWRTPFTLLFLVLGARGHRAHRQADHRTWRGMLVLMACATLGVVAQLNLKAGPSFGYGILPDDAPHEPRERDYFFALAFWGWGLWAGLGAAALGREVARRFALDQRVTSLAALGLASMPIALNWRAVDRSVLPDAALSRQFAIATIESAPPNAVLVTWGDNDTYPLWYAQEVEGLRRDVTVVPAPLLPARWYRDEIARRTTLLSEDAAGRWAGQLTTLRAISDAALQGGRPVAVVVTMPEGTRDGIAGSWSLRGLVLVAQDTGSPPGVSLDSAGTRAAAERLEFLIRGPPARRATDPTIRYMRDVIECPRTALRERAMEEAPISLATVCNLR